MSQLDSTPRSLGRELQSLVWQPHGPLTRELQQAPAGFGLGQLPQTRHPDRTIGSVCGFCSVGCQLRVHLKEGVAIGVTPAPDYPVNVGMACPKGWQALSVLKADDRATTPMLKDAAGVLRPVDWETALQTFTRKFQEIQRQHGPESVAFLSTGQIATEEMALLGAVAKFGMGMVHGDGNTRQCMASAVVAYKEAFGFDAPPLTYRDLEESDVIVLVGANPCIAHPILWERIVRNRHRPELIVVDPRRTETAMQATQHLAIRPKSDLLLFYGLARILIDREAIDKKAIDREFINRHCTGFEEFESFLRDLCLDEVVAETGISLERLQSIARLIQNGRRVSFWWTMGVNQSHQGVRTAQSLINLALMTGNIGRPGTGAHSITGQCNAMGSRLFSNTTGLLGGRNFTDPQHRSEVARILQIDETRIPSVNSASYHEILEQIDAGKIRGLWVIGTNPAHSWIDQNQFQQVLDKLDFLVVQDMYTTTETARQADLLLPAAGWGEKEGTFINSERRIGLIRKVSAAPGQALADFSIFRLIAEYWGCGELFREWNSPAAVFQILKRLSRHQPCDFSGVTDYRMLEVCGGIQWPFPEGSPQPSAERRLFEDGRFFHADGRAKFCFEASRPLPEPVCSEYPLLLLTGRGTAVQWHTQTRTAKSAVLRKLAPSEIYVEIHPQDARRLGVEPHQKVTVTSRRGHLLARAFITASVPVGQAFIPMHYPETNRLTQGVFDPWSKQPAYKSSAVRISTATTVAGVVTGREIVYPESCEH